jgi:hypothetical protein
MSMKKLIEAAINKYGSIPELHKQLIKSDVNISLSGLRALVTISGRGDDTRKLYSALNRLVNNGNWTKTGKLIDED